MLQFVINVASFAFQISGAILLLLWSLNKCDQKIKKMSLADGLDFGDFNGNVTIDCKKLQSNAKTTYLNILAFLDIIIGYACAIFAKDSGLPPFCIFIWVALVTTIIVLFEQFLSAIIAKVKYSKDETVNINDL